MRVTTELLQRASDRLSKHDAVSILRSIHVTFGRRAAILSSMQKMCNAVCHLADRAGLELDVLFVDTGVLHPETLATRDHVARMHPSLNVITLTPERTIYEQVRDEGVLYLSKEGQERCCDLRKSDPLRKVRGQYDALISGLRREEGGLRSSLHVLAPDTELSVLRVHPLVAWTARELDAYTTDHQVVVNPLHALGYPSIGCFPCTTPARPDEPERAGRWRHLADVAYCGINPTDRGVSGELELADAYAPFFA